MVSNRINSLINRYLVRFVSERAPSRRRAALLRLLCASSAAAARVAAVPRRCPPTLLEWRAAGDRAQLPLTLYDGTWLLQWTTALCWPSFFNESPINLRSREMRFAGTVTYAKLVSNHNIAAAPEKSIA